jgi:hypothetical protein
VQTPTAKPVPATGRERLVYLTVLSLAALFVLGFSFIVNEEIFKGVGAFTLHPSNE